MFPQAPGVVPTLKPTVNQNKASPFTSLQAGELTEGSNSNKLVLPRRSIVTAGAPHPSNIVVRTRPQQPQSLSTPESQSMLGSQGPPPPSSDNKILSPRQTVRPNALLSLGPNLPQSPLDSQKGWLSNPTSNSLDAQSSGTQQPLNARVQQ